MTSREMLTAMDANMLAAAFPVEHAPAVLSAAQETARLLSPRQWTGRFAVQVASDEVLIPTRLHFASTRLALLESDKAWPFARALQTRSNDGFERQRAARDLLRNTEAWGAPFIVGLIGEYIVEILQDVDDALTPELEQVLGAFIVDNAAFWATTKRRVASYWNAYYRSNWVSDLRKAYRRHEYVGFDLIYRLDAAASRVVAQRTGAVIAI